MLIRYDIPIPNYYGDAVFFQHVYFETERCPTKEEFIAAIKVRIEEDNNRIGWEENLLSSDHKILETLECRIEEWPTVSGRLVGTNSFVHTTEFGRQPLSVQRITPIKLTVGHSSIRHSSVSRILWSELNCKETKTFCICNETCLISHGCRCGAKENNK